MVRRETPAPPAPRKRRRFGRKAKAKPPVRVFAPGERFDELPSLIDRLANALGGR